MVTSPFKPRVEKDALAAALTQFHEQWQYERSMHAVFDLCDAAKRANEVFIALRQQESHDPETSLQWLPFTPLRHRPFVLCRSLRLPSRLLVRARFDPAVSAPLLLARAGRWYRGQLAIGWRWRCSVRKACPT